MAIVLVAFASVRSYALVAQFLAIDLVADSKDFILELRRFREDQLEVLAELSSWIKGIEPRHGHSWNLLARTTANQRWQIKLNSQSTCNCIATVRTTP